MSSYRRLYRAERLMNLLKASRGMTSTGRQPIFDVETRKDFEQRVINSDRPVVVDFHASWCCPCKALAPRLENIVSEQGGRVRLARVDIDEHGELAMDYNVGSVPSLVVISKGKVVNRMVGLQTSDYIRKWLHKVVPQKSSADVKN
ncbi:thioredoxin, mitochondrial [Drosophila subpulchrella]|uniref:thioredoxin, mitochondrial n=1 Tax=Drosophila subpulchrella TaxID=1486046 RepID=UPI0018A164D9|nr:thioredoxin, mitochondrial [Drosophila subpulchrella]